MEQVLDNPIQTPIITVNKEIEVYSSLPSHVKHTFKVLLSAKGWDQSKLGQEVGVSKGYISQIVNSKRELITEQKIKIAKCLGVDSRVIWP